MAVELKKEQRKDLIKSLQRYFREEYDEELSELRARLLLDYIVAEIGPAVYNRAIADAQQYFQERTLDLEGSCHEVELPYWNRKTRKR